MNVPVENQTTSVKVRDRGDIEVSEVPTTTVVTTTTTTTPPIPTDMMLIGTSSPRISLLDGSPSRPTITVTCRPRTWMQKLTEGQISEPWEEDNTSGESSVVETLPEEIPDELGHEWRVLHPFDLPGVRFPADTTSQTKDIWPKTMHWWNLSKQQSIWMKYPCGDRGTIAFTHLIMETLSIEEEVEEEEEEVEEEESGYKEDKWRGPIEDLLEGIIKMIL